MLVVLESAGLLVDRVSTEWHLSPGATRVHHSEHHERRPSRVWTGISQLVASAWNAFRRAQERRALIRDLSMRDDRLLADIGITRAQIPEIAASVDGTPQHPTRMVRTPRQVHYNVKSGDGAANDNVTDIAA